MSPLATPDQSIDQLGLSTGAVPRERTQAVFGQVMGLVALTVGCAALGAYLGRDLTGGVGIAFFIGAFACIFGLNIASGRGHEQLAIGLLFGLGLLLGLAVSPVLAYYAKMDPAPLWQAAGTTAAFVARARLIRLRDPTGSVLVGAHAVLGAAGADRVRDRDDASCRSPTATSSTAYLAS